MKTKDVVGGAWLVDHFGMALVQPLAVLSRIGGRRSTCVVDDRATETYVESMRPSPSLRNPQPTLARARQPAGHTGFLPNDSKD